MRKGKKAVVLLTASKKKENKQTNKQKSLNVDMHSDVYEWIWFKL